MPRNNGVINRFPIEHTTHDTSASVDTRLHTAPIDGGLESFSNLPLQVLLHFNKYFYVAWAVAVLIITERNANGPWSFNLTGILYCTLFVLEPLRILMGYFGNLTERISGLAAFGLVTLFLSVPSGLYIMVIALKEKYDSRNPMVLALNIIFNVILLGECVFTYGAMDKMSQHESAHHHVLNPTLKYIYGHRYEEDCFVLSNQVPTPEEINRRIDSRRIHTSLVTSKIDLTYDYNQA